MGRWQNINLLKIPVNYYQFIVDIRYTLIDNKHIEASAIAH